MQKINNRELFSGRLKLLRGVRSKADFAREIGVSAPLYQNYENGRIPASDKLLLIAQKTGKTVDWLLGRNPIDLAPVADAAKRASEAGGSDEEVKIITEINNCLRTMKSVRKSTRERIKKQISNRVDEYCDYCDEQYASLHQEKVKAATQLADRIKDKASP